MTREAQIEFVCDLMNNVRDSLVARIRQGDVPEAWDGHELRQWILDRSISNTYKMDRARMADYKNEVIVRNL